MGEIARFKEVTKRYGDKTVVDHLNLSIYTGEILGLLGPNGAGKSTTLNMLCGSTPMTSGEISIFHKENIHCNEVRTQLGLVPQELAIYPELTVEENITFFASLYGFKRKVLKEKVEKALEWGNLSQSRNEKVETLAIGVKRRVNLVCGIVHEPKLLILDEPTVAIDLHSRQHIIHKLKGLRSEEVAIIYTSHYMEEVEELCDRIAILSRGKLIAIGTIQQLSEMVAKPGEKLNLDTIYLRLTGTYLKKEGEEA